MTNVLTDAETRNALLAAGVPRRYHGKNKSLLELGPEGTELSVWVKAVKKEHAGAKYQDPDGLSCSLFLYGPKSTDGAYGIARGLLFSGVACQVICLPDLYNKVYRFEEVHNSENILVYVVLGYNDKNISALGDGEQHYAVQWWLHRLLDSGKIVVFQGSHHPSDKQTVWGETLAKKVFHDCGIRECK